jgi:hypothetical protein
MPTRAYRQSSSFARAGATEERPLDLWFAAVVGWLTALVDVVGVERRGGDFDGLHALAVLVVVAGPVLAIRALGRAWRRRG